MGEVIKYLVLYSVVGFLSFSVIYGLYVRARSDQENSERSQLVEEAAAQNSQLRADLEALILQNMHDENSYNYVGHDATYDEDKDCIVMEISFRGNNVHGSKVLNKITADVSWDLQSIKISEQPDWTGWDILITTLSKKLPDQTA